MEQVLRGSDNGILVYVAPTKALVMQVIAYTQISRTLRELTNAQIAAEVYARYRKDLNGREFGMTV